MLIIRREQMEVLEQYMLDSFVKQMVIHLQGKYPEKVINLLDSELRELIQNGIIKGESYGIEDVSDVERFLEYLVCFSPNFGESPETAWARDVLQDVTIDGSEKMNRIDDYNLFELYARKL